MYTNASAPAVTDSVFMLKFVLFLGQCSVDQVFTRVGPTLKFPDTYFWKLINYFFKHTKLLIKCNISLSLLACKLNSDLVKSKPKWGPNFEKKSSIVFPPDFRVFNSQCSQCQWPTVFSIEGIFILNVQHASIHGHHSIVCRTNIIKHCWIKIWKRYFKFLLEFKHEARAKQFRLQNRIAN